MKVLSQDMRNNKVVLKIEVEDDLYTLMDIISNGDKVIAFTKRRLEKDRGLKKAERAEKKPMTLAIEVENVSLDPNVERISVLGKIVDGPADVPLGEHHSINIVAGKKVTIIKEEWSASELLRIKEASKVLRAKVLLIAIEEGYAALGMLRNYDINSKGVVTENISGKDELKNRASDVNKFFKELENAILNQGDLDRIIIAGPGFTKDNFYEYLKEKESPLAEKTVTEGISTGDEKGLQEILKRGLVTKVVKECKVQEEVEIMNSFFAKLSKDSGFVAYGFDEVKKACGFGAIETLLVSRAFLKEKKIERDRGVDDLIKVVESSKGTVSLIGKDHELGEQLYGLGGVAAILRFKIN